jgi:hypothetical protein
MALEQEWLLKTVEKRLLAEELKEEKNLPFLTKIMAENKKLF